MRERILNFVRNKTVQRLGLAGAVGVAGVGGVAAASSINNEANATQQPAIVRTDVSMGVDHAQGLKPDDFSCVFKQYGTSNDCSAGALPDVNYTSPTDMSHSCTSGPVPQTSFEAVCARTLVLSSALKSEKTTP